MRLGFFVNKLGKLFMKVLKCAAQDFMNVVKKDLEVEEKMSVIVAEEEAAMLAASSVRWNKLIIETEWLNFVVGVFRMRALGPEGVEVSFFVGLEGGQDAEHLQAPKVLLALFYFESLDVSPYSYV